MCMQRSVEAFEAERLGLASENAALRKALHSLEVSRVYSSSSSKPQTLLATVACSRSLAPAVTQPVRHRVLSICYSCIPLLLAHHRNSVCLFTRLHPKGPVKSI